jgi:hypothetical protein
MEKILIIYIQIYMYVLYFRLGGYRTVSHLSYLGNNNVKAK